MKSITVLANVAKTILLLILLHSLMVIAKLSQKSKIKLQLLAEMVIFTFNPPNHPPTHPDKYEGDEIEQTKVVCLYE